MKGEIYTLMNTIKHNHEYVKEPMATRDQLSRIYDDVIMTISHLESDESTIIWSDEAENYVYQLDEAKINQLNYWKNTEMNCK